MSREAGKMGSWRRKTVVGKAMMAWRKRLQLGWTLLRMTTSRRRSEVLHPGRNLRSPSVVGLRRILPNPPNLPNERLT